MKVLGIMWEANSTAALVVDGQVVAAVSEERFSRQKNDERYPKSAIDYVLSEGGISGKELDAVAFIGEMWGPAYILTRRYSTYSMSDHVREQHEYWKPFLYEKKSPDYLKVFREKLDIKQYPGPKTWKKIIQHVSNKSSTARAHDKGNMEYFRQFRRDVVSQHLQIDPKKIHFIDHSTGHAMYAYFSAPTREDALVLTADAWGDDVNASISVVRKGRMKRISSSGNFIVARLYRYITLLLGMKPNEHEFKVMGLAPYAKKKYIQPVLGIFDRVQRVQGVGFKFIEVPPDLYFHFQQLLEGLRFDAIAGGLQEYTERILSAWVMNAMKKTGLSNICFGGGVAMNIKANLVLQQLPGVRSFYVSPSPDDASQAIGACYTLLYDKYLAEGQDPREKIHPLQHSYLGPSLEDEDIEKLIRSRKIRNTHRVIKHASPEVVAKLLANGAIVARAAGRSEFGPRALGNRSIIADPRSSDVIAVINEKIKSRDFWMPFAATILERRAKDYLIDYRGWAPYMTLGFETHKLAHTHLRAGLHPSDLTCRPQVLLEGQNLEYQKLIEAFEKETGVGGLLNTSFNLHGEPVVQTVEDAWRVFELSDLDALLLNDTLILKR